ncbi:hypothetical protein NW759_017459, partial [Fusarium solani]
GAAELSHERRPPGQAFRKDHIGKLDPRFVVHQRKAAGPVLPVSRRGGERVGE